MSFLEQWKKKRQDKKNSKYKKGLKKSSLTFSKEIKKISSKYKEYNNEYLDELENILIASDMGMKNVLEIISTLNKKSKKIDSLDKINEMLVEIIINIYNKGNYSSALNIKKNKLNVILMVGVNGTGKTTTAAKLCKKFQDENKKVLLIAADTFRAGATEQLVEWANKLSVDIIKSKKTNQDPASLVFDGLEKALKEKYDIAIIDTAGRLQNKVNLMKELNKIKNIVKKKTGSLPAETLLVLDAITGKNGISQAKIFSENSNVTGLVLTKMDGSSKGGISLSIKTEFNIPIKLIGFGEKVDDLQEFNIDDYIYSLTEELFIKDKE